MSGEFGGELLDEHGRFLRRLAAALVRDPHRAEDVAQETWLRWFTRPPRDRSRPRQWLATVTRGVASNLQRGEGRRAEVEGNARPSEDQPTPLDSLRQAERIERVAAAVRALEAPYREVILARHFRGLSVRELALETGTSEDTLRTRERRALEQLRAELDREFGGRDAWALVLSPFRETATSAPATHCRPSGPMRLAVSGTLVGAGALGLFLWRSSAGSSTEPIVAPAALPASTPEVAQLDPSLAALASSAPQDSTRTPIASTDPRPPEAMTSAPLAEIRGRFLLENGAPAVGTRVWVEGLLDDARADIFGMPGEWTTPSGLVAVDGSFSLRFDPPRAFTFELGAQAEGHVAVYWQVEPAPGAVIDLGTFTLERGATIAGQLLDASGAPVLAEGAYVGIDARVPDVGDGRWQPYRLFADVDPWTGTYLRENLPSGACEITAHVGSDGSESVKLQLRSGEERTIDLVVVSHSIHDPTRLSVNAAWAADHMRGPARENVRLRGEDGREWTASAGSHSTSFAFERLPAGRYALEIIDPWFEPWSRADVEPGTSVRASLVPCARVRLVARDGTDHALPDRALTVGWLRRDHAPEERAMHELGKFDGIVPLFPGDHRLRVRSGSLEAFLDVTDLGFDETRAVEVVLREAACVTGRLRRADGTPIAFHDVLLLEPAQLDDSEASPILSPGASSSDGRYRKPVTIVATDLDGRFRLRAPVGRELLVHARHPGGVVVTSERLTLAPGEVREGLELVLPDGAELTGRVVTDAGIEPAGLRLWVAAGDSMRGLAAFTTPMTTVGADGRFALAGLGSGEHRIYAALPAHQRCEFGEASGERGHGFTELATVALVQETTSELELSLRDRLGELSLEILVDGVPVTLAEVQLQRQRASDSLFGRTSADGRLGPLLAFAGDWSVVVRDPGGAWTWSSPVDLHVEAGVQRSETLALDFAHGSLRITDAEGRARAHLRLLIAREGAELPFMGAQTNAEGRVELGLAPGTYRFKLSLMEAGATVEWSASGPLVAELVL